MYFARGISVVYYGDEQGFTGDGGDRGAREDMMPSLTPDYNDNNLYGTDKTTADDNFDTDHPIYLALRDYAQVYYGHKALRQGQQRVIEQHNTPGIFAFTRTLAGELPYFVVYNSAQQAKSFDISGLPNIEMVYGEATRDKGQLTLAPLSFVIFKAK